MSKKEDKLDQKGLTPILLIFLAAAGIVLYILLTSVVPFKDKLFSYLYPKPASQAAGSVAIGFNIRGAIHYPYHDILPYTTEAQLNTDLTAIQNMGGTIIRVFAGNNNITSTEEARRLGLLLNNANSKGISVIISLINLYGDNGFHPQGMDGYYADSNGYNILQHRFFTEVVQDLQNHSNLWQNGTFSWTGQNTYVSFVKEVVNANKNHTNIYAWEPGNELTDPGRDTTTFKEFMKQVTSFIKKIDSTHAISTGMINSGHAGFSSPGDLYDYIKNSIDIISIHYERAGLADVIWARQNGKRSIAGEIGINGAGNRFSAYQEEIDYWISQGVEAILPWGYLAKSLPDNGDGDRDLGIDGIWHTDYDILEAMFKHYSGYTPPPTPNPITCNTDVILEISPNTIATNGSATFTIRGDASTYMEDNYGRGISSCTGEWNNKTCTPSSVTGTHTWTHKWKRCVGDFDHCSDLCTAQTSYTIVSSQPSLNQSISLGGGWNLVGLTAEIPGYKASDLMADLNFGGNTVDQIIKWNNSSNNWDTANLAQGGVSGINFDVTPGVGYFVKSSANSSKTISGIQASLSSLSLNPGWNLISLPTVPSSINKAQSIAAELTRQGLQVSSISRWINGAWQTAIVLPTGTIPANNFDITAGEGYFVNLKVGGVFTLPTSRPVLTALPCTLYTTDIDKNSRVTGNDLGRFVACNNRKITDKDKKGNLCKASDTNADLRIDKADYDCIRANIGKSYKLIKATKNAGAIPAFPTSATKPLPKNFIQPPLHLQK